MKKKIYQDPELEVILFPMETVMKASKEKELFDPNASQEGWI